MEPAGNSIVDWHHAGDNASQVVRVANVDPRERPAPQLLGGIRIRQRPEAGGRPWLWLDQRAAATPPRCRLQASCSVRWIRCCLSIWGLGQPERHPAGPALGGTAEEDPPRNLQQP